jgi:hypothetical protein
VFLPPFSSNLKDELRQYFVSISPAIQVTVKVKKKKTKAIPVTGRGGV